MMKASAVVEKSVKFENPGGFALYEENSLICHQHFRPYFRFRNSFGFLFGNVHVPLVLKKKIKINKRNVAKKREKNEL